MIDYCERLSKMADAAEGKQASGKVRRWVLLPAAGASLYALVRSDFFSRQAKEVVDEARSRAAELPDDLMTRVQQATNGSGRRTQSARRSSTASSRSKRASTAKSGRSRRTSSARKPSTSTR
jgi:hypothetical protein